MQGRLQRFDHAHERAPWRRHAGVVLSLVFVFLAPGIAREVVAAASDAPAAADSTDLSPMQVVERVNAALEVDALSRNILFRTFDKRGRVRERSTVSFRRDFGEERRLAMFFTAPASIRDTAVLTLDYPATTDDDQWLYLPALRKVRRVPSADRGDDFLGTDFSYEDMKLDGGLSEEDYSYSFAGDTAAGSYILVGVPRTADIAAELGYSRHEITVDASDWLVRRVVFWDEDGELFKTLTVDDVRVVDGRPTRHLVRMDNHRTGGATELVISEVDYLSPISESVFTQQALKRGI